MSTYYFEHSGHAWPRTPKMKVSACKTLWCLSACQKYTSSLTSFLRYYILPAIWLANSILARNWRTRILPDMRLVDNISFHFRLFPGKSNDKIFQRNLKKHSLGTFLDPFLPKFEQKWIFLENGLCLFLFLLSTIMRKMSNWLTDRQMENSDFKGPSAGRGSNEALLYFFTLNSKPSTTYSIHEFRNITFNQSLSQFFQRHLFT